MYVHIVAKEKTVRSKVKKNRKGQITDLILVSPGWYGEHDDDLSIEFDLLQCTLRRIGKEA